MGKYNPYKVAYKWIMGVISPYWQELLNSVGAHLGGLFGATKRESWDLSGAHGGCYAICKFCVCTFCCLGNGKPTIFFDDLLHPQFFEENKDKHEGNGKVNQFDYHHQKNTHLSYSTRYCFFGLDLLVRWLDKNRTHSPKWWWWNMVIYTGNW